jgi:uncharacterized protein YqhQ
MSNQPAVIGPDGVARPYIGGQALIEGVMMRSPHSFAAVVRRRNGQLVVKEQPMKDPRKGKLAWPLVRGVVALGEALKLGSRALRFSAEIYERDLDDQQAQGQGDKAGGANKAAASGSSLIAALSLPIIALVTSDGEPVAKSGGDGQRNWFSVLSVVFALAIFVALPQAFAEGTNSLLGLGLDIRSAGFQLLTAAAKLTILIGYMLAIRRIPEIYRVFQYHGAEHKSIYTYECGEELSVNNARPKTTLHPRCGTTFIVMVALVSILVFTGLGPFLPRLGLGKLADNLLFFLLKLPFLPVIAAVTFELQRLFARYCNKGPLRALLWPGFLVQKITTIEPDDAQLEVALGALLVTLRIETGAVEPKDAERTFESFGELALPAPLSAT